MIREFTSEQIAVGAIGPPGGRTFYIQVAEGPRSVTLKLEKQQVAALAAQLVEILDRLASSLGADPVEPAPSLELTEPFEPLFTAGTIGVGFDEDRDLVLLEFEELDLDLDESGSEEELETVRIWTSRTRTRSFAQHAADVVSAGRPTCELCGNPKDDPHVCPRSNGHRSQRDG